MKLVWSDPAVEDLEAIHTYIGRDSGAYARQFVGRILQAVEVLKQFPKRGRNVPEASDQSAVRELLFQSYRILYRVETERVVILAVIHGSRDLSRLRPRPWEVG
jgi:plasmid stabilization system protein ParE